MLDGLVTNLYIYKSSMAHIVQEIAFIILHRPKYSVDHFFPVCSHSFQGHSYSIVSVLLMTMYEITEFVSALGSKSNNPMIRFSRTSIHFIFAYKKLVIVKNEKS